MTEIERRVWAEWNALPDDEVRPVRTIAARLGMTPADDEMVIPAELDDLYEVYGQVNISAELRYTKLVRAPVEEAE